MSSKLADLADIEGMTIEELLEAAVIDSECYGICSNPNCEYTTQIEPDSSTGYCEHCGTNTVTSCCVLAGII